MTAYPHPLPVPRVQAGDLLLLLAARDALIRAHLKRLSAAQRAAGV